MAYASSVGIMPGAATEKLPFIHSNFKPRSKLAKCFVGFKKFIGPNSVNYKSYRNQKLPQIHYSGFDENNSTFWDKNTERTEYRGFTGRKKSVKKKENRTDDHENNTNSGSLSKSRPLKPYLSLPNLSALHKSGSNLVHTSHTMEIEGKRSHPFDDYDDERQRCFGQGHQLDSLIFYDEDEDDDYQHQNTVIEGSSYFHNNNNNHSVKFRDTEQDSYHRFSPSGHYGGLSQTDTLAKGVEEKLRVARGKSGMKRGRRREPDHARMLGDVVTAERMHELLRPKKDEGPLQFE